MQGRGGWGGDIITTLVRQGQTQLTTGPGGRGGGALLLLSIQAYSPVNLTGSPQGFLLVQISHIEYNTKYAHYNYIIIIYIYKSKTYKHNPKISPISIALVKKWQIKLEDAGTIDRFCLALQYQLKKIIKKNQQQKLQIKNTI